MCRKEELFIFQADVRAQWRPISRQAAGARGSRRRILRFARLQIPPTKKTKGGEVRIVDSSNFKVSTTAMGLSPFILVDYENFIGIQCDECSTTLTAKAE